MPSTRSPWGEGGLSRRQDAADRAAVADEVAIQVESVGAELHNAIDALAVVAGRADDAAQVARRAGWTHERVEAALDAASAQARLRALDHVLSRLASAR